MEGNAPQQPSHDRFVFINSTSDHPIRTRQESFAISSHVSKTHRARLRDQKLKRLHESLKATLPHRSIRPVLSSSRSDLSSQGPLLIPSDNDQAQHGNWKPAPYVLVGGSPRARAHLEDRLPCADSSQHVCPFDESQEKKGQPPHQPISFQGSNAIPTSALVLWKGNSDPFSAAAVPLHAFNNELLRQAQKFFIFTAWPDTANAVFRTSIADTRNSHIQLRDVTADEGQLHAVLASGCQVESKLLPIGHETAQAQGLAHKARAVSILRQRLGSGEISAGITTLIRLLISLEFNGEDHNAALVHLRGLWTMAKSAPSLLLEIEQLLFVSDVWIAMSLRKRPEISPARYDPGDRHLQPFNHALGSNSRLPSSVLFGDDHTLQSWSLDSRTSYLLRSANEIVETKELMSTLTEPMLQNEVVQWMHKRATAISSYLTIGFLDAIELSHGRSEVASLKVQYALTAAACLVGILFMNLRFCESPSNYNFSKPFHAIEPALQSVSGEVEKGVALDVAELYLWLLFMCAIGNDVYSARGDITYSPWSATTFHQHCTHLHLYTKDVIKNVLSKFLYYDLMDDFLVELLSSASEGMVAPVIPWAQWCSILNHYVP